MTSPNEKPEPCTVCQLPNGHRVGCPAPEMAAMKKRKDRATIFADKLLDEMDRTMVDIRPVSLRGDIRILAESYFDVLGEVKHLEKQLKRAEETWSRGVKAVAEERDRAMEKLEYSERFEGQLADRLRETTVYTEGLEDKLAEAHNWIGRLLAPDAHIYTNAARKYLAATGTKEDDGPDEV